MVRYSIPVFFKTYTATDIVPQKIEKKILILYRIPQNTIPIDRLQYDIVVCGFCVHP
jgi:hypothetical protein